MMKERRIEPWAPLRPTRFAWRPQHLPAFWRGVGEAVGVISLFLCAGMAVAALFSSCEEVPRAQSRAPARCVVEPFLGGVEEGRRGAAPVNSLWNEECLTGARRLV